MSNIHLESKKWVIRILTKIVYNERKMLFEISPV